jgi:Tfp pilus assembly protein PilF
MGLCLLASACGGAAPPPTRSADEALVTEPAVSARDKPKASPLVREAEALLQKGDAAAAKQKLKEALAQDPNDARALLALGLCEEALENFEAAQEAYRGAIAADDSLAEAHNNLGLLLRDAGQGEQALAELRRATELDPQLASAQANLAMTLEEAGRIDEARAAYERAVSLAPDDAMLRANQGLFLLAQGQNDDAYQALQTALGKARGDRATLLAIGNGLRRAGHPDEAVRAMGDAIAAGDGKPTPALLSELALAQVAAGAPKEARASLEQALSLDPKYATGHYVLAGILATQGDFQGAAEHYKRCLALSPRGPLADKAKEKLESVQRAKKKSR